jgi:uncharacterized surface protein with fasciclin (FAS1) repeats
MVSHQGTYEFFNNEFAFPESAYRPCPLIKTYQEGTVMWYIEKYHPKFAFLVKTSRLDYRMDDPQFQGTVFLPLEESIVQDEIINADANTATKIVRYHFMNGLFPRDVLYTSPYQQLQPSMDGNYIMATITDKGAMILNYTTPILYYDIQLSNGIIHIVSQLLDRP